MGQVNNPLVSIVVPAYNASKYIQRCVNSLLSQTYTDFEIVIVDDGSSDGTYELLVSSYGNDSRIRLFRKKNGGATSARKMGVENARGEWILFSDADDTMPNRALHDLLEHDDGKTDIIAGTIFYKSRNRIIRTNADTPVVSNKEYICLLLSRRTYYGPCSKLIKRKLFEGLNWNLDKKVFQNEDLLMLVHLSAKSNQHISLSNDVIHYICEDKEGSMSTRRMSYDGWKLLFNDLRKVIIGISEQDTQLFSYYVNYTIWTIYDCLLIQAINIPQDAFLRNLVKDSGTIIVDKKNVFVLTLLSNRVLRYLFCKYRCLRMRAKHIINNVM